MSEEKKPRTRRTYTPEFKQQLVDLYRSEKRKCDIIREYDISSSMLDRWIAKSENSGSFKEKDNDILKQAALILGRR